MSIAAVRTPAEYESQLRQYLFERSEEGRALRAAEEDTTDVATRERLYRLRKTCEAGFVSAEMAEREDALENAVLAARIEFKGEELPLRSAQARLAVLPDYGDREQLGAITADGSAEFNDHRLELLRAVAELEGEISGEPDAIARNEEEKGISLRELEAALEQASERTTEAYVPLREK